MYRLKKQIAILLSLSLLLCLSACNSSSPSVSGQDSAQGSSTSEPPSVEDNTADDTFYPAAMAVPDLDAISENDLYRWNSNGTLTFQNKNELHTLSAENQLLETITLPAESLSQDTGYSLTWNDSLILAVNAGWSSEDPFGVVYFTDDGGVHLANLTLFNRQGELIRQYPQGQVYGYDEAGEYVSYLPAPENTTVIGSWQLGEAIYSIHWLDGETAIFNCHSRIVLYDFSADTGRVLDDMSDLVDSHEKFGVYYGAEGFQCGVIDGSFYYLAHRDEEESNRTGTIWKADKNGAVQLFDGMEFYHLFVGNQTLTAVAHTDSEDIDQVYCAGAQTLDLKEVWKGKISISFVDDGRISFTNQYGQEKSVLFSYDYETGELASHELSDILQIDLFFTRSINDSLLWYYTVFDNGTKIDYMYDSSTSETTELPEGCLSKFLSIGPDGFPQDSFLEYDSETHALRVRQLMCK